MGQAGNKGASNAFDEDMERSLLGKAARVGGGRGLYRLRRMDFRTWLRFGCLVTVTWILWNGCAVGDAADMDACLSPFAAVCTSLSERWAAFWKHSQYFLRHLDFLQRHPRCTTAFDFCQTQHEEQRVSI